MLKEKFVCPICGFESNGGGFCPTCDDNLQKVCNCGSGKFSIECCNNDTNDTKEETTSEELIKAEVSSEALKEKANEDVAKQKEEEELENVEEVKE